MKGSNAFTSSMAFVIMMIMSVRVSRVHYTKNVRIVSIVVKIIRKNNKSSGVLKAPELLLCLFSCFVDIMYFTNVRFCVIL